MAEFSPEGTYTALVTPFTPDAKRIDWPAFEAHVQRQLAAGVQGVVVCGTTGESATLSPEEQAELIARTVRLVAGRTRVIAGTGCYDTRASIDATKAAFAAGVDAAMLVVPYYTRPSQTGLRAHFAAIAQACPGPLIVYNVPGRTVASLLEDTLLELIATYQNIVALKDASNNVLYCQNVLSQAPRAFKVLSGDDALTLPMMSVGARGVISVTSNVYPKAVKRAVDLALAGRWDEARELHLGLLRAHRAMFCAPSPAPTKAALAAKGLMNDAVRLPMTPLDESTRQLVQQLLASFEERETEHP